MLGKGALAFCFLPLLPAQTGAIEGAVSDSTSRAGLAAVRVTLSVKGSKEAARSTVTGAAGAYSIEGLQPGDYEASFSKEGYSTRTAPAHVTAVGEAARIDIALVPQGSVSGRVLDPQRHPMANVLVRLSTASRVSHIVLLMMTETGKDGSYRFQKLEPGAYMIEAMPVAMNLRGGVVGGEKKDQPPELAPPNAPPGQKFAWANTYYPGVPDRGQAARVVIHGSWDLPGYDIPLLAVPVYRVRGVVFGEDGRRAAGVQVGIDFADRWDHDSDGAKTGEDGTFEFPAVHQGEWRLMAQQNLSSNRVLRGFASASVARHDLENVELRLASPFDVAGVVELEGPADASSKVGPIVLESASHPWSAGASGPNAGGSFHFEGIYPDRYTIGAPARVEGYYLASIRIGEREVLGQEVELAAGTPPLRVLFKQATGRVTGTVENGAGATVVLLPKQPALQTYQYIRSAKCNASGRYEIGSVRPGDYYAVAFTAADLTALEDPELIRGFLGSTTAVQVENGASASVDLKLVPWPE